MAADIVLSSAPPSPFAEAWGSLRENRGAVAGLIILVVMVLAAFFADMIAPYSPYDQFREHVLQPPVWQEGGTWAFLLGTDGVGRDMLSRLIHGARISLGVGLSVMIVSLMVGAILGLLASFRGGLIDIVLMRTMDLILSIPDLILCVIVVMILGRGLENTVVAVTIVFLPRYVRIVRAAAMAELSKDYVIAARVAGVGPIRLMFRTVLPNCMAPLIVQATLGVSDAILQIAALGFLGLGAQAPTPEWGAMLANLREFLQRASWVVTWPGICILVTVVALNLFGDGLRDALDPKLKRG